jgi:hypothetical protein
MPAARKADWPAARRADGRVRRRRPVTHTASPITSAPPIPQSPAPIARPPAPDQNHGSERALAVTLAACATARLTCRPAKLPFRELELPVCLALDSRPILHVQDDQMMPLQVASMYPARSAGAEATCPLLAARLPLSKHVHVWIPPPQKIATTPSPRSEMRLAGSHL